MPEQQKIDDIVEATPTSTDRIKKLKEVEKSSTSIENDQNNAVPGIEYEDLESNTK
ncbi:MAG: hypothetical protein M3162_09075 [Thermoproteota archaeon]|nr:hypothetical protein [Thermoproteota archaeon]